MWHAPICVPFSLTGLSLYALDQLYRLLLKKSLVPQRATVHALADGETTVVELPGLVGGWRAGMYVHLRVLPGSGMPLTAVIEKVGSGRPFSSLLR